MIRRPPRSPLFPYTTALPISALAAVTDAGACDLIVRRLQAAIAADNLSRAEPSLSLSVGFAQFNPRQPRDRKSTRLNSSHSQISYAVFCLKKKNQALGSNSVF